MPDIRSILKVIDYIEQNLRSPVTVEDMAEIASYSLFHFCRVFNQATHLTPYDYLIRRRLTESTNLVMNSKRKILDIALDFQFANPETFSRAFRRLVGILPSELRKGEWFDRRHLMPRWTHSHLSHIAKGATIIPKLETREPFQLVGLMTLVDKDLGVIPELWRRFIDELGAKRIESRPSDFIGISFHSETGHQERFYMSGVKLERLEELESTLVVKQVPAMRVASFLHKGTLPERQLTLDHAYHAWLPRSECQLSIPWVIENLNEDVWRSESEALQTSLSFPIF